MSMDCSFGDNNEEVEEEIDLNNLVKIKNDELTMENIVEPNSKDDQIFNQITTKEINEEENIDQIKYYEAQLIHEKIKASLNQIFSSINDKITSNKMSFFYKLKLILNQSYSNLLSIELLYMDIKTKLEQFLFLLNFIEFKKIVKAFYNIKIFAQIKKKEIIEEESMKKEKENKINVMNSKINNLNNNISEINKRINNYENIQKKLNNENRNYKEKISQMNEKVNQLINVKNSIKESINKKNMNNNGKNNNQENRIQNLINLIEQKESEKGKELKDIDSFYENMDLLLNQYEAMSETILSNCNIKNTK